MTDLLKTLEPHRIPTAPASIFYIPNFLSANEEATILQKAQTPLPPLPPKPSKPLTHTHSQIPPTRWITLTHRRLQAHPIRLTASNTLLASPLPAWLTTPIVERMKVLGLFTDAPHGVNHVLVNEYLPGQGIMPHEDGAAYHPLVATVSLGGSLVLDVTEKASPAADDEVRDRRETSELPHAKDAEHAGRRTSYRILQEPRSLLVTTGAAYTDTLHGIAAVSEDRELGPETVANWSLLGDPGAILRNGGVNIRADRISLTYRDVRKVSSVGAKIFGKART